MDSDDDDFVVLGTPLEPLTEDDELPTKKPIHEQTVHDEKGRRRFHGAFTGGFSAGYFNSVGSKEGWAPSSFLSSRAQKADKIQQNPEDFMDDEDLGAFGIAPRKVQLLNHYHETDKDSTRKRSLPVSSDGPIPGEPPLKELVKPVSASIGVKILQEMGWRPGQGIGPREKRKQKPTIKVYGCAPPSSQHSSEDEDDDPYAVQHTFAPKDQEMLPYEPKDNLFGIGYSGLSKEPVLSAHVNLFEPTHTSAVLNKKKKLIIAGEAFGVGAFEDEDADIYAKDDMTQYDFALEESCKNQESSSKPSRSKTLGYVQKVLEGFHLSSKPAPKKPKYPPPTLPSNFRPIHQPSKTVQQAITNPVQETKRFLDRHQMSSQDRAAVLEGQSPASKKGPVSSVFDLLAPEDKLKLQRIQKSKEEIALPQSALQDGQKLSSFKPFQNDPEKQARYEKYQTLIKMGKTDCLDSVHPYTMTEWEKQREKEEFQRAVMLYRPLSTSLCSRFISSSQLDNDREVEIRVDQDGDKTDQKKAAELKMYGKLTRERYEWHPAQLLCKRFNVPNPYPDSKMVGLPKVKRDKYSIFNFLTVPSDVEPSKKEETPDHNTPPISTEHIKKEIEEMEVSQQEVKMQNDEASTTTDSQNPTIIEVDTESKTTKPPMDLFKAIFQNTSSEESNSSDEETSPQLTTEVNTQIPQKSEENVQLSKHKPENFSPAFGVFANIDLDALNEERELPSENINLFNKPDSNLLSGGNGSTSSLPTSTKDQNVEDFYGPKLPPSTSGDCIYIGEKQRSEKESRSHRKHKKHKHHKHKEERSKSKKDKHKSKHKHKKSSSSLLKEKSSSEESSDSDANTDVKIIKKLHQLKRRT